MSRNTRSPRSREKYRVIFDERRSSHSPDTFLRSVANIAGYYNYHCRAVARVIVFVVGVSGLCRLPPPSLLPLHPLHPLHPLLSTTPPPNRNCTPPEMQAIDLIQWYFETLPPAPKFTEKDLVDLSSKVFFVTGGASGVGFELCKVSRPPFLPSPSSSSTPSSSPPLPLHTPPTPNHHRASTPNPRRSTSPGAPSPMPTLPSPRSAARTRAPPAR